MSTAADPAVEQIQFHQGRASDGSRFNDHIGQEPQAPAQGWVHI